MEANDGERNLIAREEAGMKNQRDDARHHFRLRLALAGLISAAALILGSATLTSGQAVGSWCYTGNLNFARSSHTATLLSNGNVLVTGGYTNPCGFFGCTDLNSAELYDPITGTWSVTATFKTARTAYSATLLPNGKVLVSGGADNITS